MKKGSGKNRFKRIMAWSIGGLFALFFGLLVGFKLWSPLVVEQFEDVLANTSNNTQIYDRNDNLIATIEGLEDRHTVSINKIHIYLQKGVVAVEDRRFFSHHGLDPIRLLAALLANLRSLAYYQGASTITQQLVKLTLLSSERTLSRKIKEVFMAVALEMSYPKLKLLEFYLNRVYLGYGLYGVEKASRVYFHKSAADLDLNQATFLAALIKKPEGYLEFPEGAVTPSTPLLPVHLLKTLRKRQRFILATLGNMGWISEDEIRDILPQKLVVYKPEPVNNQAPYFVQQTLKEMKKVLKVSQVAGRGYRVYTTLDMGFQQVGEQIAKIFGAESGQASQMALIAMESDTGNVRALVGGVDFAESQFNRAIQAKRQPGSAFKPILYAAALENGFTPNTTFVDEPVRYIWSKGVMRRERAGEFKEEEPDEPAAVAELDLAEAGLEITEEEEEIEDVYEPRNYNNRYGAREWREGIPLEERRMTMTRALELSSNVIAVKLLDRLGTLPVRRLSRRLDISVRQDMGLCIALGCSEITLIDLTSAYATFSNGGLRAKPVFIRKITNIDGDELFEHYPDPPEQVITPWTAFQMTKMMTGVVQRGTGRRARLGRPVGGKTGTNDGPRDAWFIGFTPHLVTGVWIGNDDNSIINNESGGRTPARLWSEFMRKVLEPYQGENFPEPENDYVAVRTCSITGEVANPSCPAPQIYYYKESEAPTRICNLHPRIQELPTDEPSVKIKTALSNQKPQETKEELFAKKLHGAFDKP